MTSRVGVIPSLTSLCYRGVYEALSTHQSLTREDIEYAQNTLCSHLTSHDTIALFILLANRNTTTGRFSLFFNKVLDECIVSRNSERLIKTAAGPKENFVELFENPLLTALERETVEKVMNLEYRAMLSAVVNGERRREHHVKRLSPYDEESLVYQVSDASSSLYGKCYSDVCFLENDEEAIPMTSTIMVLDQPEDKLLRYLHCIPLLDLIEAFSRERPINPQTGRPFSSATTSLIMEKYAKEIKMYKYYLSLI